MSAGRTVVEVQARRRLVREYAPDGSLLRIRIEPLSEGPHAPAPTPTPRPDAKRAKPAPEPEAPAPAPPPAPPPLPAPAAPTPRHVAVLAPRAAHVALERPAQLPELEVETEPMPPASPAVIPVGPVEEVLEAVEEEIAALQASAPAPPPPPSPPAPVTFEVLASEPLVRPAPEPEPAPPSEPEPAPVPEALPEPEPAREPEPLAPRIPDLEARVDSLLAQRQGKPAPRKRAPLDVPRFEPLARDAWEERLDAILASR